MPRLPKVLNRNKLTDKLEVLREKANEIMHQINLLEAESWVLEDGINAINEILKNKISIDHNFV